MVLGDIEATTTVLVEKMAMNPSLDAIDVSLDVFKESGSRARKEIERLAILCAMRTHGEVGLTRKSRTRLYYKMKLRVDMVLATDVLCRS